MRIFILLFVFKILFLLTSFVVTSFATIDSSLNPIINSLLLSSQFTNYIKSDHGTIRIGNRQATLILSKDGKINSLIINSSNSEVKDDFEPSFFAITIDGREHDCTEIKLDDHVLVCQFGVSGIEIDFLVTIKYDYYVFEIIEFRGGTPDQVTLCRFLPNQNVRQKSAEWASVFWNDRFAVGHSPISDKVLSSNYQAIVYSRFGMLREKVAFIAAPRSQYLRILKQTEQDYNFPHRLLDGQWPKSSHSIQGSYLFIDLHESNVNEVIELAISGGFEYILIPAWIWAENYGSYNINTHYFPNGKSGFQSVIDQCHSAGLKVGLHTLSVLVSNNDPLADSIPDSRLLRSNGQLIQQYDHYVIDLASSLKDEVAARLANVINTFGLNMVYFDGLEASGNTGPNWYWANQMVKAILEKTSQELLIESSYITPWLWHIISRGVCGDSASIAVKEHLDQFKLAFYREKYELNFIPTNLGWWSIQNSQLDHPATTIDDIELHAARMMAYDSPISLQATLADLNSHGRIDDFLGIISSWDTLRRAGGRVSQTIRRKLRHGEWHLKIINGQPIFEQKKYSKSFLHSIGNVQVNNDFEEQPIKFRVQVMPNHADPGDDGNIVLYSPGSPAEISLPGPTSSMPGYLVSAINREVSLINHRTLAVTLQVDSPVPSGKFAVLNIQLESTAGLFRDHYVDIDFSGQKTFFFCESSAERMLAEFKPSLENYNFFRATRAFDYSQVTGLNFRWMRIDDGRIAKVKVERVEALKEDNIGFDDLNLTMDGHSITFPGNYRTGEYLEFNGIGVAKHYDKDFVLLREVMPTGAILTIPHGTSTLNLSTSSNVPVKWTTILQGESLHD